MNDTKVPAHIERGVDRVLRSRLAQLTELIGILEKAPLFKIKAEQLQETLAATAAHEEEARATLVKIQGERAELDGARAEFEAQQAQAKTYWDGRERDVTDNHDNARRRHEELDDREAAIAEKEGEIARLKEDLNERLERLKVD